MKKPIVIIGPATADYLLTFSGRDWILSTKRTLYPAAELERVAPVFGCNMPVFNGHTDGAAGKIGKITHSYWDAGRSSICGTLQLESRYYETELLKKPLTEYGFSVVWGFLGGSINPKEYNSPLDLCYKIARIFSVDLVGFGAAGGRFDVPLSAKQLKRYNLLLPR